MGAVEEKEVILLFRLINLYMIYRILEGELFREIMEDQEDLEEEMGKMEEKLR